MPGNVSEQSRTRVLQALRDDGRASFARIATKAGLARHQVASIVQTALARDELRLTVSINPGLLGLERFAYLQITVSGPAQPVREALVSMSETTFVADVAGRSSVDAELRVGPDPHLKRTLDSIRQLPGVSDIRTTLYDSIEVNRFSPFPTAAAPLTIDEADRAIIRHLHTDARASYRQLGEASGLSPSGARLRFDRLNRGGAIKVVGIPVRVGRPETPTLGLGLRSSVPVGELLPRLAALQPEFLAVSVGAYDFIATISADSAPELVEMLDRLRGTDGLAEVDCWANLTIAKEQYGETGRLLTPARDRADAVSSPLPRHSRSEIRRHRSPGDRGRRC